MRQSSIVVLLCLLAIGCCGCRCGARLPEAAVRTMCEQIIAHYPEATLQDVYKTCYQDYFGAEHLMQDTAAARAYLHSELVACASTDMSAIPQREPTGFRHRFVRINLSVVTGGSADTGSPAMTEEELLQLFIDAAGKNNAYSDNWADEWAGIETIALRANPGWQDVELQQALREAAQMNAAVRHSEAFRNAYNPHYRIVRNK